MRAFKPSMLSAVVPTLSVGALALASCSDHNLTGNTPDPRAQQLRDGLVVSGPLTSTAAASVSAAPGGQLVYMSMTPGTLPGADSVQLQPVRGALGVLATSVRMADGGFDPVPIYANSGDSVPVTVF